MMIQVWIFYLLLSAPGLAAAKQLWSSTPANVSDLLRTAYPVGNGRLGAMPIGDASYDVVNLNIDSLWSGGPFGATNYTGGNPTGSVAYNLPGIREFIFENGTGNVTGLLGGEYEYGSYQVLANLTVAIANTSVLSDYRRELDLETALHTVSTDGIESNVFCSYPDEVCIYHISSSTTLPQITIGIENQLQLYPPVNTSCQPDQVRLLGITQADIGMLFAVNARLLSSSNGTANTSCSVSDTGSSVLVVSPSSGMTELTIAVAAETNYDQKHGNAAYNFSFRATDERSHPDAVAAARTKAVSNSSYNPLLNRHLDDFEPLQSTFSLNLPLADSSEAIETTELFANYNYEVGDPYLESLIFDLGRYLFITSSRPGSLPPNLLGIWSNLQYGPWSADYHVNINLQMNHWSVGQTGLGALQQALWDYMTDTWAPRGSETAKLLYDAPGWVLHDEINIFGHTAMKEDAQWADNPISAAWMMLHVWDHYVYSQDAAWYAKQGYPMLKAIAQFWLSQLQKDEYFKDGTLVVNPCNSPEHGPTTFGCAHYQQLIWDLFDHVVAGWQASGDTDTAFLSDVQSQLAKLDRGVRIGSWGQLQEWKIDLDVENDTHRHLSEFIGLHPGSGIASFLDYSDADAELPTPPGTPNVTASEMKEALITTLWSRGIGTGSDADAGWEKVWRSACWSRLNNTYMAAFELRYALGHNFANNGFSMYVGGDDPQVPFQIDANFGFVGATMELLVRDLDVPAGINGTLIDTQRKVTLAPNIPEAWWPGSVEGLRIRGGGILDFAWDSVGKVSSVQIVQIGLGDAEVKDVSGNTWGVI